MGPWGAKYYNFDYQFYSENARKLCEICEISNNTFFREHLGVTVSLWRAFINDLERTCRIENLKKQQILAQYRAEVHLGHCRKAVMEKN